MARAKKKYFYEYLVTNSSSSRASKGHQAELATVRAITLGQIRVPIVVLAFLLALSSLAAGFETFCCSSNCRNAKIYPGGRLRRLTMIPEEESGRSSRTATHQDVGGVPGQGQGEESRTRELYEGVHDVRPLARQALVEDLVELRKKSRNRYSK